MVTIRYKTINAHGAIATREKTFKTQKAMERWVAKQEEDERGHFRGVDSYSFSEEVDEDDEEALMIANEMAAMIELSEEDADSKGGDIDDIRPGDRFCG